MASERSSGSIFAVDFGNVLTRGILIDLVEGVYRLVARGETRSTHSFPVDDVSVGMRRVAQQITAVTGRNLLNVNGDIITPEQPDRSGVDDFVVTASTGRTLRTALVGLVPEVSIASGLRASAGTYIQIVETISLDETRSEEDQLNALIASHPDLIFITGGTEGGAQEPVMKLARTARLALRLLGQKPVVLYAGNSALVPQIQALFEGHSPLLIASNIRPSLEREELEEAQLQLALAFDEQQASRGGFGVMGDMTRLGVLPTAQSYSLMAGYLGKALKGNVLIVDIGSAVSTLAASLDEHVTTTIRTDIGLGHSADTLTAITGEEALKRWLPFVTTPNQIRHYILNKIMRPGTLPETSKGLYIEHALLRSGIDTLIKASRPAWSKSLHTSEEGLTPSFDLIIAAGAGLTRTGSAGYGALLLLDAIQPVGVTRLQSDPYGIIAALGALSHTNPQAVVQVLESNSLEQLGTSVSVSGLPALNRTAMKVKITTEDGQVIQQDVQGGHLWVYPLGVGKTAQLDVRAAGRGLSINGKGRVRMTVEGGSCGLIFDARGRVLPLGVNPRARAAQIPQWISELTGDPVKTIDDSWLVSASEDGHIEDATEVEKVSGGLFRRGGKGRPKPSNEKKGRRGSKGAKDAGNSKAAPADDLPADEDFQNELDELRKL